MAAFSGYCVSFLLMPKLCEGEDIRHHVPDVFLATRTASGRDRVLLNYLLNKQTRKACDSRRFDSGGYCRRSRKGFLSYGLSFAPKKLKGSSEFQVQSRRLRFSGVDRALSCSVRDDRELRPGTSQESVGNR